MTGAHRKVDRLLDEIVALRNVDKLRLLSRLMDAEGTDVNWAMIKRTQRQLPDTATLRREVDEAVREVRRDRRRKARLDEDLGVRWEREIDRRLGDVDAGRVKTSPAEKVFARVTQRLATASKGAQAQVGSPTVDVPRAKSFEAALRQLKGAASHPVRVRVGGLEIELRVVSRRRRRRAGPGLGDRMAACGPWQGESIEEILRILHEGRHGAGTYEPGR